MEATDVLMPAGVFNFAGQMKVDTFGIDLRAMIDAEDYDELMVNRHQLSLEAIRKHADEFSYWRHRRNTGRPPVQERDLLVAFLIRQCSMRPSARRRVSLSCWRTTSSSIAFQTTRSYVGRTPPGAG